MSTYLRMAWQKIKRRNNNDISTGYKDNGIIQSSSESDVIKIITDDPSIEEASEEYVLDFQSYSKNLANIIKGTEPKFAVGIFGKWGTGKTTLMKMIKQELDKYSEKILTVWFDAWRYEREKNLAVIPFLRQVRIALDKDLDKPSGGKSQRWKKLHDALEKTFAAFMVSTEFSVSPAGSPISTTTNLGKLTDSLKSKGSTFINEERIALREHSTDYLQTALDELEDARIVVFVDDLDRCTPQNAVEVIESIKTFFDLRGIVYVVGMDSESINHIIKQKYGEDSKIDGMKYLEKIVQLPFQIPVWKPEDIHTYISKIISKGLKGSKLADEFEKENIKKLIVKAIEPNPRQVKRFINNIILANEVFANESIKIDSLIAVQALSFNRNWNTFLELIADDEENTRKTFFGEYCNTPRGTWKGKRIKVLSDVDNLIKEISENAKTSPSKKIEDIFPKKIELIFRELIKQTESNLRSFLEDAGAAELLRDIERMEDYRRALGATEYKHEEEPKHAATREHLLELLKKGKVQEFNDLSITVKHPDLSGADLSGADLSGADLSGADLFSAKLLYADLLRTDLSGAKLFYANLSGANLSGANLSGAKLSKANLSGAKLSKANLSGADLENANLSGADLENANLSGADLIHANLSGADLIHANLLHANLQNVNFLGANLSGADLSGARLFFAILSNAILSNANLSGADLTYSIMIGVKYQALECADANFEKAVIDDKGLLSQLEERGAKNLPPVVKNKQELKQQLGEKLLHPEYNDRILAYSVLQE